MGEDIGHQPTDGTVSFRAGTSSLTQFSTIASADCLVVAIISPMNLFPATKLHE
ncbi:hypothetical protein [Geoalkalibacter subterraneus]|uniref:hypothetical protein n=1 Tax=Geoalkalibacter subterraneus TaxID=483547 RepID=UPI00130D7FC5|nr:hypothetical protein [Geoalkalibacter subterraneus]